MADRREVTDRHEIDRRGFLTWMGLTAAGVVSAIAGIKTKPDNSPKETPTAYGSELNNGIHQPEGLNEQYKSGEVEEGEGLILTVERISGRKIDSLPNFKLIWKNKDVYHFFESKKAFVSQGSVPLPVVRPQDKVVFGYGEKIDKYVSELGKLPVQQRVYLEAKNKTLDSGVEMTLTVFGGRFDRPVIYKLNDERNSWQINLEGDNWVDPDRFKEIMEENPEMKSSKAFEKIK